VIARIDILAVGRARDPAIAGLVERYRSRLPWDVRILEIDVRGSPDPARRAAQESERILRAAEGCRLVVLDERGEMTDSTGFARRLSRFADSGTRHLAFVIGGADGVPLAVRERADWFLSLGPMTWPHLLVRVLLLEQLYRAHTLISGHPYHRE
jgi:23S rRNA (pseudouridine1915-N3)-methyltransferase